MVPRLTGMIRLLALLTAFILFFGALPGESFAQNRSALVIGNSEYSFAPLANPGNDASDVAKSLESAGFEVELVVNADRQAMLDAVAEFGAKLADRGGVGLFFFAGHGVQVAGENYLLPIGDGIADPSELDTKAVVAAEIVEAMSEAGNELNIVILDACRDNPLTSGTSGLSRIDTSASLFVSYSTSPGSVALDGEGRNSPYAKHLTLSLATPNLNLEETFKRTLKGVYQETKGQQTPWLSSSFFGEFVFNGNAEAKTAAVPGQAGVSSGSKDSRQARLRMPEATEARRELTGLYRVKGTNPDGSAYKGMLALVERADRFDFTWWIGKDVFRGKGELAGKMLVVNWNDLHPVVYSFEPDGVLDGEWADGTATDRLTLYRASDPDAVPANGTYKVKGRNVDGSAYSGRLDIEGDGKNYELSWRIGSSSYSGTGRFDQGLLVVDWGSVTPVVYALSSDGSLTGLWDGGAGSETATPQ